MLPVLDPSKYDALRASEAQARAELAAREAAEKAHKVAEKIELKSYEPLRETERQVLTEQAAREAAAAARHVEAPEPPFMTEEDRHEANRAALLEKLDKQVQENKIDSHERRYQISRFEQTGVVPQNEVGHSQGQARVTSRHLGMTNHADLVSQQAAANERLTAGPEKANGPIKKPPGIEL
jgi:hypothetical protein